MPKTRILVFKKRNVFSGCLSKKETHLPAIFCEFFLIIKNFGKKKSFFDDFRYFLKFFFIVLQSLKLLENTSAINNYLTCDFWSFWSVDVCKGLVYHGNHHTDNKTNSLFCVCCKRRIFLLGNSSSQLEELGSKNLVSIFLDIRD